MKKVFVCSFLVLLAGTTCSWAAPTTTTVPGIYAATTLSRFMMTTTTTTSLATATTRFIPHIEMITPTTSTPPSTLPVSGVPLGMNVQGRLVNSAGEPITGNRGLTFRIYSGTSRLWQTNQTVNADPNGIFSTVIGGSDFPNFVAQNPDYYLAISYGGEQLINSTIVSVPFALTARNAIGNGRVDLVTSEVAVKGTSTGNGGVGVLGVGRDTAGGVGVRGEISDNVYGELGKREGAEYYGVYGYATGEVAGWLPQKYGVYGETQVGQGAGVMGKYTNSSSLVQGQLGKGAYPYTGTSDTSFEVGVYGQSLGEGGIGVYGFSFLSVGIRGIASASNAYGLRCNTDITARTANRILGAYALRLGRGRIKITTKQEDAHPWYNPISAEELVEVSYGSAYLGVASIYKYVGRVREFSLKTDSLIFPFVVNNTADRGIVSCAYLLFDNMLRFGYVPITSLRAQKKGTTGYYNCYSWGVRAGSPAKKIGYLIIN